MNYLRSPKTTTRRLISFIATIAFGASILLLGCQPLETLPGYGKIHPRHLLMIPREGKLHITWEARHLVVTVKGSVRQGTLSINGNINRNQDTGQLIELDMVDVDIYLTNSNGKILKHEVLHYTDNPPKTRLLHVFQRSFKLAKSTSHIAFGYDLKSGSRHLRHFPIE